MPVRLGAPDLLDPDPFPSPVLCATDHLRTRPRPGARRQHGAQLLIEAGGHVTEDSVP